MAIFSAVPPPPELGGQLNNHAHHNAQQRHHHQQQQQQQHHYHAQPHRVGVDIEAWTVSALESLSVSPMARGTGVPLAIPLDETETRNGKPAVTIYDPRSRTGANTPPPRPRSRRDSMKRREALLKGKEGSRQRRRWENDRLLHVPNAVPPEPEDYVPRPTHPVHHVPYQIAAAWDLRLRAEVESRSAALAYRKQTFTRTFGDEGVAGRVPRELCQRAKKIPAVRAWVRSLEEPVRKYLVELELAREEDTGLRTDESDSISSGDALDSEDEEIVFVGRKQFMHDGEIGGKRKSPAERVGHSTGQWKKARREEKETGMMRDEGMLFDGFGDDEGGAFRRWITHSISDYYGLQSRSVLVGDPKRKVVYVGIEKMKTGHALPIRADILPRPLWELC